MTVFNESREIEAAYLALQSAIISHTPPRMDVVSVTAKPPLDVLSSLGRKHGTDKAANCPVYELYLRRICADPINLLEIGIGGGPDPASGGASLRTWRDYFPAASIYGIDIEDKTPHAESRVHVFQGSQNDPVFLAAVAAKIGEIDVIIDDGSHVSAHIITSFETLFPFLKEGGIYIVEDIGTSYWPVNGGSRNLDEPWTTMNYFKSVADGIQWPFSDGAVTPTALTAKIAFVHFWQNFIVLQKH